MAGQGSLKRDYIWNFISYFASLCRAPFGVSMLARWSVVGYGLVIEVGGLY